MGKRFNSETEGKCTECGDLTVLGDTCCGAPIEVGDEVLDPEDFDEEAEELEFGAGPGFERQMEIYRELKQDGF